MKCRWMRKNQRNKSNHKKKNAAQKMWFNGSSAIVHNGSQKQNAKRYAFIASNILICTTIDECVCELKQISLFALRDKLKEGKICTQPICMINLKRGFCFVTVFPAFRRFVVSSHKFLLFFFLILRIYGSNNEIANLKEMLYLFFVAYFAISCIRKQQEKNKIRTHISQTRKSGERDNKEQ